MQYVRMLGLVVVLGVACPVYAGGERCTDTASAREDEESAKEAFLKFVRLCKRDICTAYHSKTAWIITAAVVAAIGTIIGTPLVVLYMKKRNCLKDAHTYIDGLINLIKNGRRSVIVDIENNKHYEVMPHVYIYVRGKVAEKKEFKVEQGEVLLSDQAVTIIIELQHKQLPYSIKINYLLPGGLEANATQLKESIEKEYPTKFAIQVIHSWPAYKK